MILHTTLIFLHILTASAWFGMSMRLGSQAKLAATGQSAVAVDGIRAISLMGMMLIATFVFSMTLLFVGDGYPGQPQYHIASTLIVLLLGVQFVFLRPAWNRLRDSVSHTEESNQTEALRHARSITIYTGLGHLLWVILLMLMFWNRLGI
ncbi:MAG: hypothetical protein OXE59_03950 [Bacteroidetes bacterium]|nr:hypothetical protein [Bacteroidota bacterium]